MHVASQRNVNVLNQFEQRRRCQRIHSDRRFKERIPLERGAHALGNDSTEPGTESHPAHISRHHGVSRKCGATEDDA